MTARDMTALDAFPPTRTSALERLAKFLPHAGRDYAGRRNYDLGPGRHEGVSTLSPYLRCRLITEAEVLQAVLGRHSAQAAEKFVQEVFWRTYWKGWLELRPGVWDQYQHDLRRQMDAVQTQSGLRDRWEEACRGATEIECFNSWAQELVSTGYLHNHARMWFASIWIFTLKLPWELGADFFLRHLLDGDPASNTLGWRWVAGVQTVGKTYLARAENIAKYTEGRFRPTGQLADLAEPRQAPLPPDPQPLPDSDRADPALRTGLLLHIEDLAPGYILERLDVACHARLTVENGFSPLVPAPHVGAFRCAAMQDVQNRWSEKLGPPADVGDVDEIAAWAAQERLQQIVTAYAPVGPVAAVINGLRRHPEAPPIVRLRRSYDTNAWPSATKGFFPFKKRIPALLDRLS